MKKKHFNLTKVEKLIKNSAHGVDEKEELWKIVEEILHHSVLACVLDNLDRKHHDEFLEKFQITTVNDEIIEYLEEKGGKEITTKIKETIQRTEIEILTEIK